MGTTTDGGRGSQERVRVSGKRPIGAGGWEVLHHALSPCKDVGLRCGSGGTVTTHPPCPIGAARAWENGTPWEI